MGFSGLTRRRPGTWAKPGEGPGAGRLRVVFTGSEYSLFSLTYNARTRPYRDRRGALRRDVGVKPRPQASERPQQGVDGPPPPPDAPAPPPPTARGEARTRAGAGGGGGGRGPAGGGGRGETPRGRGARLRLL